MTPVFLIAIVIMLVCAANFAPDSSQPGWSQHLKGSQKIFGLVGFILAVLIVMNPELLALGLLGDAAFFDILVLALSLQVQIVIFRAWRWMHVASSKTLTFVIRGVRRDLAVLAFTLTSLGDMAIKICKAAHRVLLHERTMA